MKITVLACGKLKEAYFKGAAAEYVKRISRFHALGMEEVPDMAEPAGASDAQRLQVMEKEGKALLQRVKDGDYVIALSLDGPSPDSVGLSKMMDSWLQKGATRLVLIIGGSLGLSDEVLGRANAKLCLSNLTLPHGLCRVVLLEQLYRAMKISAGESYHK